ncbi:7701_t:CDS:2 [Scutellospora calospora]|uniref:7701_t:CDS:1 n=1 Tax=Scutellospora calospora TaxID=85575 RepID=A0ACA9M1M3_9GLOM|nr:7701_t:CDS:2 [Scutellospora calospora]
MKFLISIFVLLVSIAILVQASPLEENHERKACLNTNEARKFVSEHNHAMKELKNAIDSLEKRMVIYKKRADTFAESVLVSGNDKRSDFELEKRQIPRVPRMYFNVFTGVHAKHMSEIKNSFECVAKVTHDFQEKL